MKKTTLSLLVVVSLLVGAIGNAYAISSYVTAFNAVYSGGSCSTCHTAIPSLNAYGSKFAAVATHSSDPQGALRQIGSPTGAATPPPAPAACTYTYSAWGTCGANGTQTRTVVSSTPAGCTGTPVLQQACTPPVVTPAPAPAACTYTYSAWGACGGSGTQTRSVISVTPAGCTGTPVLQQTCTPPVVTPAPAPAPAPAADVMPVPATKQVFYFAPVDSPVLNADPAKAKPIGVGPVAQGGETLEIRIGLGQFAGPVDVSFGIHAVAIDPIDIYFLDQRRELKPLSKKLIESALELRGMGANVSDEDDDDDMKNEAFRKLVWKSGVTSLAENIFGAIPVDVLPQGLYVILLKVSPAGTQNASHLWITSFVVN